MANETPETNKAGNLATQENKLPLQQTVLIGTNGTDQARHALIRLPSGSIRKVTVGDVVRGNRVDAIEPDRLLMSRNGRQSVLNMPRG